MRKFYLLKQVLVLVMLLGVTSGWAQTTRITGRVVSGDDGTGLPGVSILEKGTTNGTVTDAEGNYGLNVSPSAVLVYSFVGYTSQEVSINGRTTIDITMESDVTALGEVVIIGYGQQEKKDVTGSVLAFSTKDFNRGVITSPQELLVGKVAGVQITTNSGAPGAASTIRIRGGSSLNANNDPLIVIDGFPVDNNGLAGSSNPLATLNPNDIESINVLKDASGTAIYGSRASNGVIIITTKRGAKDKLTLNYSGNYSISQPVKYLDVLSGDEYRALLTDLNEAGSSAVPQGALDLLGTENTDWQKEVFRTAFSHDHNVNAAGTTKNLKYRVSYGYTDQQGILRNTDLQRNSLNINVNPSLLDGALNINASLKGSFTKQNFGNEGAVGNAVAFDPTQPVRSADPRFSRFGGYFSWLEGTGNPITIATANPVALLEQTDNRSEVYRAIGTLQADYALPFVPGMTANVSMGFDVAEGEGHNIAPTNAAWSSGGPGRIDTYTSDNRSKLFDFFLNYKREVGKHRFDATAGYSYQDFSRNGTSLVRNAEGRKFTFYEVQNGDTVAYRNTPNPNTLISVFGRLNYSLNDRYLLTATLRNDASSRFSPDTRSGWFPSVALGWRINEENFLVSSEVVSTLKLRLSYGITGQQDIGPTYPYLALITQSTETAKYQFGNNYYTTYRPDGFDAAIRWEETTTWNAGIDFGFSDERLTGTFDVYKRETRDLLNSIPVPAGSNLTNYLFTNVGSLENKGYEVALNYAAIRSPQVNLNIGVNFTHNQNEITQLTRVNDPNYQGILVGGISGGVGNTIQNHQVGYPASSFFVFQQIYGPDGRPIEGLYVDETGAGGQVVSSDQNRIRYYSPNAEYLAGINANLTYKAFDFGFSGRLSLNNYVYNNVLSERARYTNIYNPNGFLNNVPKAIDDTRFLNAQYLSSYYVSNASFFKMDYITAGYSFNSLFTDKLKGRIGLTVNNAFFITEYDGLDPEVNGGIDNNIYPRPRVFMFSLNLTY